ncbi:hypothetical protein STRIC_0033 [Streptococcus ictaluri 707-05]|uniref:Uncharacterized protein n=1 Tax=Streptococcus ictaluri 707-05 TaxID=764299 RepID=G5K0B3_9STRE|nr:hypothetical protein STRIC_0033 [Streptococcus ictaluri 707-05]
MEQLVGSFLNSKRMRLQFLVVIFDISDYNKMQGPVLSIEKSN